MTFQKSNPEHPVLWGLDFLEATLVYYLQSVLFLLLTAWTASRSHSSIIVVCIVIGGCVKTISASSDRHSR